MSPECFIKSILLSIFFIIQNSRKIRSKELFLTGTKKKIYLSERHFLSRIIFPPNGKKKKMRKEIEIIKFDDESKPQIKFIGCKTTFQMEQQPGRDKLLCDTRSRRINDGESFQLRNVVPLLYFHGFTVAKLLFPPRIKTVEIYGFAINLASLFSLPSFFGFSGISIFFFYPLSLSLCSAVPVRLSLFHSGIDAPGKSGKIGDK